MTNIIRDVWKDFQAGRVYLPQEDLARFQYSQEQLAQRQYNQQFLHLMQFEAARAREFFGRAAAALPAEDRRAMAPAEIMGSIYRALLGGLNWTSSEFSKKNIPWVSWRRQFGSRRNCSNLF